MADKTKKIQNIFLCAVIGSSALLVSVPIAKQAEQTYARQKAALPLARICMEKKAKNEACAENEKAALDSVIEQQKRDAHFWVFQRGL